jgi:uncharacterized membrane protein YeaQ/YmgE (transglycosylase-associated protein family)
MKIIMKLIITIIVGFIGFIMVPAMLMEASGSPNAFINIIIWGITGAFLYGVWNYGDKPKNDGDKHVLRKD